MNATLKINSAASAAHTVQLTLDALHHRALRALERLRSELRHSAAERQAIEELYALNDRQLRDIGLNRSDIVPAVRGQIDISR